MKRYIRNLIAAILGRAPDRKELEEIRNELREAAADLASLKDLYYNTLEKWDSDRKNVRLLRNLVENLRARIREKDEVINQIDRR